jgi:hypothetical protein
VNEQSKCVFVSAPPTPGAEPDAREVSWLEPCFACGGAEGCAYKRPHAIFCRTLDNGLGRRVVRPEECEWVTEYDLFAFRHVPPVEAAVQLLRRYFFSRTDVVCHFARWDSPCPAVGEGHLDAMLRAHVGGKRAEAATIHWQSRKNAGEYQDRPRIGTYGPAPDGTTR